MAAVTLAATPRFLLFARRIIIDVYSSMFLGLTLLCFTLAETDPPRRRRWLLAMYRSAWASWSDPVAVAVPALVFLAYLLVTRQLRAWGL
jgi:4-amino-4-deoxy-L-arabinose transferase-like glycosyltransferase